MLINRSDDHDGIIKFPHNSFKHINFVSLSVYFRIISGQKMIAKRTDKKYDRDWQNSKHIIF